MRSRNLLSVSYYSVWLLFLVGFVAFGWRATWSRTRNLVPLRATPYASTDAFLSKLLGVENGSERIRTTLDQLPGDEPMIFLFPANDNRWDFVGDAVSYLTWPRRVQKLPVDPRQVGDGRTLAADSGGVAAIFCGIDPPSQYRGRFRIGQHLIIASVIRQNE